MYARKMADTIISNYPEPNDFPWKNWTYSQGFLMLGMLQLFERSQEQKYLDYIIKFCDFHIKSDGSIPFFKGDSLDNILPGSIVCWLYHQTREEKYLLAAKTVREALKTYPRNDNGGFWHAKHLPRQMWVDGLFMGSMFMLYYGRYIGEAKEMFQEVLNQQQIGFDCLEKDDTGLLYHGYCEDGSADWAHPISGKSAEIWSEGLGWYALVLPCALAFIPQSTDGWTVVHEQYKKLIGGLQKVQNDATGMWLQVVDKPHYQRNFLEISGSSMFLYSMKKGRELGLLDESVDETIQKAYRGVLAKTSISLDGKLSIHGCCDGIGVQKDYDTYVNLTQEDNAKEALAAFLWLTTLMEI